MLNNLSKKIPSLGMNGVQSGINHLIKNQLPLRFVAGFNLDYIRRIDHNVSEKYINIIYENGEIHYIHGRTCPKQYDELEKFLKTQEVDSISIENMYNDMMKLVGTDKE